MGIKQYQTGIIPFNTVFNLQTSQVQQQDALAVAQGNIALNLITLYRALGRGWEYRLNQDSCAGKAPRLCRRAKPGGVTATTGDTRGTQETGFT